MVDYVLDYFDDLILDKLYAKYHPASITSSTLSFVNSNNASSLDLSSPSSLLSSFSSNQVSAWDRNDPRRQFLSLLVLVYIGIHLLYFIVCGLSYYLIFDHRMMKHPRFLKNQVKLEIKTSLIAFPYLDVLTTFMFILELHYSQLYDSFNQSPWGGGIGAFAYALFSSAFFLIFTDYNIYWIHRGLHHPSVYKYIHKPHHKWVVPTPFASYAFHPLDGFAQSVPYHLCVFIIPIHKLTYIGLFVFVNLWTILIHDSELIADHPLEHYINGPSHHTLHHIAYTVNYGQYFTWADKWGGSFRLPAKGDDPLLAILTQAERKKMMKEEKQKAIDACKKEGLENFENNGGNNGNKNEHPLTPSEFGSPTFSSDSSSATSTPKREKFLDHSIL